MPRAADSVSIILAPLFHALRDFDPMQLRAALENCCDADTVVHMCHPFGDMDAVGFYENALTPLFTAFPDLERRETIQISGTTAEGLDWVGTCGNYIGTFAAPFLNIPPTGHLAHMRFHEFYQIKDGKISQMQIIWDIPELMMQAGAWPMAPSLGREWPAPAPMTLDGINPQETGAGHGARSMAHVIDMLTALSRHPKQPASAMQLEQFWHPKMNWYGPAGIRTARGIAGFRHWHQIPFLNAMPDRGQQQDGIDIHFFAQGDYVAVTGWPDMAQNLTGAGWLGIAASGQNVTLRSLDFWRLEGGKIRENWVLVDLLDLYNQLGVDVLARLGEFNKSRHVAPLPFPIGGGGMDG